MAMSRNARRRVAKARVSKASAEAHNNAIVIARREARKTIHVGPCDRTKGGVSRIYSGAANPVGYTKPVLSSARLTFSRVTAEQKRYSPVEWMHSND